MITKRMVGAILGDILGFPYEFKDPVSITWEELLENSRDFIWSDDTSMSLATYDAIQSLRGEPLKEDFSKILMEHFLDWYRNFKYSPIEGIIDIGITTEESLKRYEKSRDIKTCGSTDKNSKGNGALMRLSPFYDGLIDRELLDSVVSLTHNNDLCQRTAYWYFQLLNFLDQGFSLEEALEEVDPLEILTEDESPVTYDYGDPTENEGYVLKTLAIAVQSCLRSNSFEEVMVKVISLGGDTDTNACIAGSIAGLIWKIPEELELRVKSLIKENCQ